MSPLPLVCFEQDICEALRLTSRTFQRLLRHGAFPVPELPRLDRHRRWSGAAVTAFIESEHRHTVTRSSANRPRMSFAVKSVAGNAR